MLIGVLDFEEFPLECQPSSNGNRPGNPIPVQLASPALPSGNSSNCYQILITVVVHPEYCGLYLVGVYIKEFKCTISSSDVLPSSLSDKFDSAGVDLCRLPENLSLAMCKFSMRAFEAFRFCGMAENEDNECFQGHN